MLQEPVLFSTSIAENIAYGRPAAGDDAIVVAARAANAHEFIVNLPEGYETKVGERGMRLSGGEREGNGAPAPICDHAGLCAIAAARAAKRLAHISLLAVDPLFSAPAALW